MNFKLKLMAFSKLKQNWDSYNADEISLNSIITAHKILNILSYLDTDEIHVFPMRNGGIQIDIGEFKEIEIFNNNVKEIQFDSEGNILSQKEYQI